MRDYTVWKFSHKKNNYGDLYWDFFIEFLILAVLASFYDVWQPANIYSFGKENFKKIG